MKILLVTRVYPAFQGHSILNTSYALHQLVRRWIPEHEVMVVRLVEWPTRVKKSGKLGMHYVDGVPVHCVPLFQIPRTAKILIGPTAALLKRIVKFRPDIVLSHCSYGIFLGHRLAKYLKKPNICGLHFADVEYMEGGRRYSQYYQALQGSEAIACRSPVIQQRLKALNQSWFDKSFPANSGIEKDAIIDRALMLEKVKQWKRGGMLRFVTASKLRPLKNIDIVLRSLAALRNGIEWNYTIIGDGPEKEALQKLAVELGIREKVRFTGIMKREGVLEELRSSHVFVMVSAPETFGLAYLEAMASGNIVIGARGYGIDGIVVDGQNGFLCTPRDERELAQKLQAMVTGMNEERVAEIACESWETANELTDRKVSELYLSKIEETLHRNRG